MESKVVSLSVSFSESTSSESSPRDGDGPLTGTLKAGYLLQRRIGTGRFGVIYKAFDVENERAVAVKIIDLFAKEERDSKTGPTEVEIYKRLALGLGETIGTCILSFYNSFVLGSENRLFTILELGDYNVYQLITRASLVLTDDIKVSITRQMSKAIIFLHQRSIIHRDIKPENYIYFKKRHRVKLCDFGFAKIYDPADPPSEYLGTIDYIAPEIVRCSKTPKAYGPAVDLWALGVTVYELSVGKPPFYHSSEKETFYNILMFNDSLNYPRHQIPTMNVCHFLSKLMKCEPASRVLDISVLRLSASHPEGVRLEESQNAGPSPPVSHNGSPRSETDSSEARECLFSSSE